jgi:hypothetical protein
VKRLFKTTYQTVIRRCAALKLSFPENEGAVKGNFPAGASMPVRDVVRTTWAWDSVIFFSGLCYEWPHEFKKGDMNV